MLTNRTSEHTSGWRLRCPACGKGKLYNGLLSVCETCPECDFPLAKHDTADGPAFIIMLILNFLIMGLALWLEFSYHPPLWVHAVLWPVVVILLCVVGLRYSKSLMISAEYKHNLLTDNAADDSAGSV